eukprot:TRINITY_DN1353_c2_g1_i6.p1 TRINITY_DN1353_c2_g1~~TRINITY_DN1353_c2_g1_i6.p1  ORF type:complete len:1436 (+),score=409.98 TRINITY_DN1353_c2_g1_i6:105-4412(+)
MQTLANALSTVTGAVAGSVRTVACWALNVPAERVARFILSRLLNRFVVGLEPEQFQQFSLSQGKFRLESLQLAKDTINSHVLAGLPLRLVDGRLGEVEVKASLDDILNGGGDPLHFLVGQAVFDLEYVGEFTAAAPSRQETGEDFLRRSLLIGDVRRGDVDSLLPSEGEEEDAAEIDPAGAAQIQAAIDRIVQRIRVSLTDARVCVRFPAATGGSDRRDVFRLELPWVELRDHQLPQPQATTDAAGAAGAPSETPRFFGKAISFQTLLVYLETGVKEDMMQSGFQTAVSPRFGRTDALADADLIMMGFADERNDVRLCVASDASMLCPGEPMLSVKGWLSSLHCLLRPRHVRSIRSAADHVLLGDSAPAADAGTAAPTSSPVDLSLKVGQLLAAVFADDAPTPGAWDELLQAVTDAAPEEPPSDAGALPSRGTQHARHRFRDLSSRSPCANLQREHLLVEVATLAAAADPATSGSTAMRPPALSIKHNDTSGVATSTFAVGTLRLQHRLPAPAGRGDLPSCVQPHTRVEGGMQCTDLLTTLGDRMRPTVAVHVTRHVDAGVLRQVVRVRVSPWVTLPLVHLPRLAAFFHLGDSESADLRSCPSSASRPGAFEFDGDSGTSPLSAVSSEFDETFQRPSDYSRPPPYGAPDASVPPRYPSSPAQPVHRVTFGPPKHSRRVESSSARSMRVRRDVTVEGAMFVVSCLLAARDWDSVPMLGPYLREMLKFHTAGEWLDRELKLEVERWQLTFSVDSWLGSPARGAAGPPAAAPQLRLNLAKAGLLLGGRGVDRMITLSGPGSLYVTLPQTADPAACATLTRGPSLLPPGRTQELEEAAARLADVVVSGHFDSCTVALSRSSHLYLVHALTELAAAVSSCSAPPARPQSFASPPPGPRMPPSGLLPMGLLQAVGPEGLAAWQLPQWCLSVDVRVTSADVKLQVPRCFPPDVPPPASLPYPKPPPCHLYEALLNHVHLNVCVHNAADLFVKVNASALSAKADEQVSGLQMPILRSYHRLYNKAVHGTTDAVTPDSVRLSVTISQCSEANPAFEQIHDRQDVNVVVALRRMLYTFRAAQKGDQPTSALAEMFTDVQRIWADPRDLDDLPSLPARRPGVQKNRLRLTQLDLMAEETLLEYQPIRQGARALIAAEFVRVQLIAVLLSEELRTEITASGLTLLLDDGQLDSDLVEYDAAAGVASLFGKSRQMLAPAGSGLPRVVADLELLGFVQVAETKHPAGVPMRVTVTSIEPFVDYVPHLRGRGAGSQQACDRTPIPSRVAITDLHLEGSFCTDSFGLFNGLLGCFMSDDEAAAMPRVLDLFREAGADVHDPAEAAAAAEEARKRRVQATAATFAEDTARRVQLAMATPMMGRSSSPPPRAAAPRQAVAAAPPRKPFASSSPRRLDDAMSCASGAPRACHGRSMTRRQASAEHHPRSMTRLR